MSSTTFVGEEIDQTTFDLDALHTHPTPSAVQSSIPEPTPQPLIGEPVAERPVEQPQSMSKSPEQISDQPQLAIQCLCPFCGSFNSRVGQPCTTCNTLDNNNTRAATEHRSGPWYLLQPHNPDAPGMNFDHLIHLIRTKGLNPHSVVRGPTTGQLWRLASKVRGLSREFGQCYSCGYDVEATETLCPHCDRRQTVPEHPDAIPQTNSGVESVKDSSVPSTASAQVIEFDPESPKAVRQALLAEPIIHVHSLAHPDHIEIDPMMSARPVVAECSERHMPKDDLLTPADLAKAFQLQFGGTTNVKELNRFLTHPGRTIKRVKIALTSVGALLAAVLIVGPMLSLLSGWLNAGPDRAVVAPVKGGTSSTAVAFARNTDPLTDVPFPPSYFASSKPVTPDAGTATSQVPSTASPASPAPGQSSVANPEVASAIFVPTIVADSAPSVEDDPHHLWESALDAESTGNYTAAVTAYERIESLPSNTWPSNLEVRLTLARREAKGDLR